MAYPFLVSLVVGVFVRAVLSGSTIAQWLADRNEISTPLTSWKRVTEGLSLAKTGVDPYDGDLFHQPPLMLWLLSLLNSIFGSSMPFVFVFVDILTAIVLEQVAKHVARHLLHQQKNEVHTYSVDSTKLLLSSCNLQLARLFVPAVFLLNPFTIAVCVAKSTVVFNNLTIAFSIYYAVTGNRTLTSLFIAISAYTSLYPIMLLVPAAIHIAQLEAGKDKFLEKLGVTSMFQTALCTTAALIGLLYSSFMLQGSWTFVHATYGFILSVPDLTPNMGIFWYFFTEMFEHFRLFFVCVFQINVFIYTLPLSIKLSHRPMFLMYVLLMIMAVFKSYPCYGDAGIYLALLPMWKHTFAYLRNSFVVACMFIVCVVLAPILWHLWIYSGSANANFFFAITLVYSTAQIFLLTDVIFAFLRREYDLIEGTKVKMVNGKEAQIILD